VNAIALLMGLLVLSYVGSVLVGTAKKPGLPSGLEFVGLGFAVGPQALGFVERPMITDFEPIVQVALGWLAFVVGLDFGRVEGRRVPTGSLLLGIGGAVFTGSLVAVAVFYLLRTVPIPGIEGRDALVLAAGAGAVCAETARNGVEWARVRWGADGPISELLVQIGAADDLALLVAAGAIFALAPAKGLAFALSSWGWFGASFGLGALLGVVTAMLLRGGEGDAVWGALIGTLLLGVGVAARFGFCTIFVTFVMGVALATASPSRRALRKVVGPTERAVLYPMLLLAGARLDPRPLTENKMLVVLVGVVLMARVVAKIVSGALLGATSAAARAVGARSGLMLLSSGPVSTACGFVFALRFPGPIGDTLLICAIAAAVVGELVSTLSLRSILTAAGEISLASTTVPEGIPAATAVAAAPLSSAHMFSFDNTEDDGDEDPAH
jgi:hypothetical protein